MNEQQEFRKDFLTEFVRRIIKEANYPGKQDKYDSNLERIKQNIRVYEKPESALVSSILMNQVPEIQELMTPYQQTKDIEYGKADIESIMKIKSGAPFPTPNLPIPGKIIPKVFMQHPTQKLMHGMDRKSGMRTIPSSARQTIMVENPIPVKPAPATPENITAIGLEKIDEILKDQSVQTVECPGPNKQILVYKSGAIQAANFSLTSDEIKNVMKEISEKTRIPMMSGVFKASYGNLLVTAVMSEFVGTRFIVQKKPQLPPSQSGSVYQQ